MDMPFTQAEPYLTKITASIFNTLNTKITNQNVLKRILIAMVTRTRLFQMRISGYDQRNPCRPCTSGRLHLASWGGVTSKLCLVLVHFGLIKLKPKQNTSVFPTYFTC